MIVQKTNYYGPYYLVNIVFILITVIQIIIPKKQVFTLTNSGIVPIYIYRVKTHFFKLKCYVSEKNLNKAFSKMTRNFEMIY